MITGLSTGTHTIVVRDGSGCEVTQTSGIITEPKEIVIDYVINAGELTVKANYGTGIYEYKLDSGAWQDSPVFTSFTTGQVLYVRDQKGCEVTKIIVALSVGNASYSNFKLYPNPTEGKVSVSSSQIIKSVAIYDLLGKRIMTINGDSKKLNLNVSQFEQGMYLVDIIGENNKSETKKLIIK